MKKSAPALGSLSSAPCAFDLGSTLEQVDTMNTTTPTAGRVRAPEVMVSYSSQDRERVTQFVRALRASGVAVWIDQGGIDGAQRWSEEIVNAIEACRTVLLFISRNSMMSQNIAKEVALAWESGKEFLPVALDETKVPKSMQYQLAGIQYVKLYEGDPDVKFESVLRALVRLGVRVSPYSMAVVSAGIGEREQALEWLEKACEERNHGLSRLKGEPRFNAMRTDPRFVELAKRAEALELDEATTEIVLPQPLTSAARTAAVAPGPAAGWKRFFWPDIVDGKSARQAAGQGVWAAMAIIALFWIVSSLVPSSMMTSTSWWNDPIVVTVIWGAIGFAVQKMSRPAAIIGTGLCVLGAWFNLSVLSFYKTAMDSQKLYAQYSPTPANQPDYSALYYATLFGIAAGIVFVLAFVNATRGTLAYRQMVVAGKTEDKQDAVSPQDFLGARRKVMGVVQRVWGTGAVVAPAVEAGPPPAAPVARVTAPSSAAVSSSIETLPKAAPVADKTPAAANQAVPQTAAEVPSGDKAPSSEAIAQFPTFDDAPEVHKLGDLIGADTFRVMRVLAFLAANVATGLAFIFSRSVFMGHLHPVYWQTGLLRGVAVTLATVLVFRFIRSGWIASLAAAALTTLLMVAAFHFTLATFTFADIFYREQFQEFILVPFVDVLVMLLGLYYLIPRVRPLALGLFVGSVCAEVVTSMLISTLRDLGSGTPPDRVLAGTLVFFVGVRSVVFAAVFWGGLKIAGIGKTSASHS